LSRIFLTCNFYYEICSNRRAIGSDNQPVDYFNMNSSYALKIFSRLFFISFFACTSNVFAQWTPCSGTSALTVYCLAAKDNVLFAGTAAGVFFSPDTGSTWTLRSNGITADTILSLFIADSIAIAGTKGGGIFRSSDNGLNWQAVNTGVTDSVIHCFTGIGTKLFAGGDRGEVFSSDDYGYSWQVQTIGIPSYTPVYAMAVSGTELFAGHTFGIEKSIDTGSTWMTSGVTVTSFLSFAVTGSEIYGGAGGDGIFYSTDHFATFAMNSGGMVNTNITSIVAADSVVFASSDGGGVHVTTNHSLYWDDFNTGLADIVVNALTISGNYLFAGTASSGVWKRSLDEVTEVTENYFLRNNDIIIYPNPARSTIIIDLSKTSVRKGSITIVNLCGEVSYRIGFEDSKYVLTDISELVPGIYFIQVSGEKLSFNKKIAIN
jgi:hypothetical protein